MVKHKINDYLRTGKISKIFREERERYLNFFSNSYKENLEHCKNNLEKFPRWAIISGYYAMHDITKLFLADNFNLKINFNVHQTTIEVFEELINNKEIVKMLNLGYKELLKMMNDLVSVKKERTNAQYYTGTKFMKEKYQKEALEFLTNLVLPFINEIKGIKNDKSN